MLDCLIVDANIVDGTGTPSRVGDVGIRDGRIVAVGEVDDTARRRVNAGGLIACPGFIDIHTHYDAQVMWDPSLAPSSLNGVTTVFGGNCGFTIAPISEDGASYLLPMLAKVEGMPIESLEAGLDLNWSTFGSWLDRIDGSIVLNAGFLVGHSAIRRLAMGSRAVGSPANDVDIRMMAKLVHESLEMGAVGLSSSNGEVHTDQNGDPVPSRFAEDDELFALCSAVGQHPGTILEFIPTNDRLFSRHHEELIGKMSSLACRSLNWNVIQVRPGNEERESRMARLESSARASQHGGRIVALSDPDPSPRRMSMLSGFVYETISPEWAEVMHMPIMERVGRMSDSGVRERLEADAGKGPYRFWNDWPNCRIADVENPELRNYVGELVSDIAERERKTPFEALLDVVTRDEMRTGFEAPTLGDDDETWQMRRDIWRLSNVVVGGSDAGAHLDMNTSFAMYIVFLKEAVIRRGLLSWEEAVQLITEIPGKLYGVRDRGTLQVGNWADINLLDPTRLDVGQAEFRADLPGRGHRRYSEAIGIERTFVNGVEIAQRGRLTGATPGRVLKSGRDTFTVEVGRFRHKPG